MGNPIPVLFLIQSKGSDTMDNALTITLFISIDVSSKTNYVFGLCFFDKKLLSFQDKNNLPDSEEIISNLLVCLKENNLISVYTIIHFEKYTQFIKCTHF